MTCKDCLYYEVCINFRNNICITDQERFEEYVINSDGLCDRFKNKADFVEVVRCKDCGVKGSACCMAGDFPLIKEIENCFCSYGQRK